MLLGPIIVGVNLVGPADKAPTGHTGHSSQYKAIRTLRTLNSSSIYPSHQDSLLYTHFFRTHHPLYLILYINYQQ
jgi:hypothetical protein